MPEPPKRLVIYSSFTNNQDIHVQLNTSRFVLDNAPEEFVSDVNVEVFEENTFLQQLIFHIPGGRSVPYYSTTGLSAEIGKKYIVKAFLNGFDPVVAESTIPVPEHFSQLSLSNIKIDSIGSRVRYNYTVNLRLDDPQETINYYHINLYQQVFTHPITGGDDEYVDLIPFEFSDNNDANEILANVSGGLLLEDNPLNGNYSFGLGYEINPVTESLGKVFIELRTVSKEYYQFHSSVTRQKNSPGGVLTEPVFIYNNIEGGHGIFAGYSSVMDSLSIID